MAKPTHPGGSDSLQIYQDSFPDQNAQMMSQPPAQPVAKPPRRPLQASGNGNVVLDPPSASANSQSPFKSGPRTLGSPLAPLKASQGNKLNMVSFKPPQDPFKATDSMQKKQPVMSRFKTVAQKPPADSGLGYVGKENNHPVILPAPPAANLSIESYYQKPPGKRLLEPAPIKDSRPLKRPRLDEGPLPPHDSFPPIIDDGTKPGHSYAMLIGMAILRSPQRRLTLSQIYKWISDTYSFYSPQDAGWQNSIRHNLSLNKAFVKQERPKDDPGKGNYWAIESGMEHQFMKEKPTRKSLPTVENLPVMSTLLEPSLPPAPILHEPALPPQLPPAPHIPMEPMRAVQAPAPAQPELSSDATIPISDSAVPEEPVEKTVEASEAVLEASLYSPLPAAMHSSPPIPRHIEARSGTPPPPPRFTGSSASRSRRRKCTSMDDSGYISSLDSSVLRSNQNPRLLTSEADRPKIKRGRAEEEIARLRASSYESPSKGRPWNGYAPPSSSPLRHAARNDNGTQMLPPLTPAVKLKAPPKPPPSVSPSTNLRLHRDRVRHMLASPLRRISTVTEDAHLWGSPGGNVDESVYNYADDMGFTLDASGLGAGFEIFQDDPLSSFFSPLGNASPEKHSVKRLRLDRSQSTSVLGDVTNSAARRSITSAPFLKAHGQSPAIMLDTPSKIFEGLPSSPSKLFTLQSPSKMPPLDENAWISMEDLCATEYLQDVDDFGGLDILQGFEKIGSNPAAASSSQPSRSLKGTQKPPFGRSYTTSF